MSWMSMADFPAMYVFCICLLANKYQKYKLVELGDQLGSSNSNNSFLKGIRDAKNNLNSTTVAKLASQKLAPSLPFF